MENPINGSFKKYKFHIAFSITVLAMLSLIVPVHNLYLQPTQADPTSNIKKSVDKSTSKDSKPKSDTKASKEDTKPKSDTVRDAIKEFTSNTKPTSTTTADPKPTSTTTNPTTKASVADPHPKVGQLLPPPAKEALKNVFVKLSDKVPAIKYGKVGQLAGDLGFN
jgi:cytoskeletal protein RodZ